MYVIMRSGSEHYVFASYSEIASHKGYRAAVLLIGTI